MSQPLAYLDSQFMESEEARPLRILAEYLEPLSRFRAQNIQDTVVFFGSARIRSRQDAEHSLRQRFSLFHEFKHIIDHPTRDLIENEEMAERVADYFAACVLMPKAWVSWRTSCSISRSRNPWPRGEPSVGMVSR